MPAYLIVRLPASGDPRDAAVTQYVADAPDAEHAAPQGYTGDGRYAVLDWDERAEFDLCPGPISAQPAPPANPAEAAPAKKS